MSEEKASGSGSKATGRASTTDQGFDAVEGKLRLTGWRCERRVVVLRRRAKSRPGAEASKESPQQELQFVGGSDKAKLWEYAVLVTNADYSGSAHETEKIVR